MEVIVKGREIELTDALKDWVRKKLAKIEKRLSRIHKVDVELEYFSGKPDRRNECEITVFADNVIFRATAENDDMYVAVDKAVEKLEKQIEKYKGRTYQSENKHHLDRSIAASLPKEESKIVKRKRFRINEMSLNEAVEQMEYLGHDFFLFINRDNRALSVLYERKDGNLGLIETEIVVEES
jgi:putative sigma-54 modulation protein